MSNKRGIFALSPMLVFMAIYLVGSLLAGDFYKIPLTVAFMAASVYAVAISGGVSLKKRIEYYSKGAGGPNLMLMLWIFVMAGAFAHSAKEMGSIDATVNLTLSLLPGNMILAGMFVAACFISLSVGTSVGTIAALTPVAIGLAERTGIDLPFMVAVVVGGSFFGENGLTDLTAEQLEAVKENVPYVDSEIKELKESIVG